MCNMKGTPIQTISIPHITTTHVTITKYHHSHTTPPPHNTSTTYPHHISPHQRLPHHTTLPPHNTTYNLTTTCPHHVTLITPFIITTFSHNQCMSPSLPNTSPATAYLCLWVSLFQLSWPFSSPEVPCSFPPEGFSPCLYQKDRILSHMPLFA